MKRYLLLSKVDFASLIKFGKIPSKFIPKFSGDNLDPLKNQLLQIFQEDCPPFESDETYLIIEAEIGDGVDLAINQALKIYPLTEAAKYSYELKFDSGFTFEKPIFEGAFKEYQKYFDIQEHQKGANAIQKLFGKYFSDESYLPEVNLSLDHLIALKMTGQKSFPYNGNHFYEYLFLYERDEFFPNNDLGYFYDVGQILAHETQRPSFKGSVIHDFLQKSRSFFEAKKQLSKMIPLLEENNEKTKGFKQKLTSSDGEKRYITALYFLYLKNILSDKDSLGETNIEAIVEFIYDQNLYIKELLRALLLIGYYFGYSKFYYDLYQLADVKIYKNCNQSKSESRPTSVEEDIKSSDVIEVGNKSHQKSIFDSTPETTFMNLGNGSTEVSPKDSKDELLDYLNEHLSKGRFELKKDHLKKISGLYTQLSGKNKVIKSDILDFLKTQYSKYFVINGDTITERK